MITVLSLPDDQQPAREEAPATVRMYVLRDPASPAPKPAPREVGRGGDSAGRAVGSPGAGKRFTSEGILTRPEIVKLKQAACLAFKKCLEMEPDAVPPGMSKSAFQKLWTHREEKAITGVDSLNFAKRSHFRTLMARWAYLSQMDVEAFELLLTTGPATGKAGRDGDTHEDRQAAMRQLWATLNQFKPHIGYGYADTICRRQFRHGLNDATAKEILNVRNTCYRRGATKAGGEGKK